MSDATVKIEKKLNRKVFLQIAEEYEGQTGEKLCDKLLAAQSQSITDIQQIKQEKLGKDLRVNLFKLADYDYLLGFCPKRKKKRGKKP